METSDLRVKDLHGELGVSKGHASEILSGEAAPSQKLALRIYRRFGVKLGPIAHLSGRDIDTLERLSAKKVSQ
jgi:transcriptional regulator with XRE-family HTH domain